ncbi:ABC transporter ATP-binding protein [Desulforhopalus sp. IMCC35007]|uniref:ABC transporter ATP-binding protein n=1 Tax=Desulforhopalus sp. IMCC35007 TaxID=2569543 RepID=UPI0010ADF109|nr:ABC transporter ATP-binding protein [Desulforhopalus sp. IMCC35007]TKB05857.1 ABC transporter ATP-binding protein [Desulforhopalus sp. IMCC35007]
MLRVDNITVVFGGVTAVKDVAFGVKNGELLGLIGPNGAGKTTLMRVITGTVTPVSGSVSLINTSLDRKSSHERIRAGIGLSQQIVHPFRSMTVGENVAYAAGYAKTRNPLRSILSYSRKKEMDKAREILKLLDIEEVAEATPTNLPLGYLKRLEVARALALQPKILLLDEPLAGLNQMEARKLADKLLELNRLGQTILLIEHNLSEVIRICGRIIVIDNGIKIGEGEPQKVMRDPDIRSAYLGEGYNNAAS